MNIHNRTDCVTVMYLDFKFNMVLFIIRHARL